MDNGLSKSNNYLKDSSDKRVVKKFLLKKKHDLESQITAQEAAMQKYEDEMSSHIEILKRQVNELKNKFRNSQSQFSDEHHQKYYWEKDLEKLEKAKQRFQTEIAVLDQKNRDLGVKVHAYEEENKKRLAVLSGLKSDHERLTLQEEAFRADLKAYENAANNYEKETKELMEKNVSLASKVSSLEDKVSRVENTKKTLQSNYLKVKSKHDQYQKALEEKQHLLSQAYSYGDELKNKISRASHDIGSIEEKIYYLETKIEKSVEENKRYESELIAKQAELENYNQEHRSYAIRLNELEAQLSAPRRELKKIMQVRSQASEKLYQLQVQINAKEDENSKIDSEIDLIKKDIEAQNKKLSTLEYDYNVVQKKNKSALETLERLTQHKKAIMDKSNAVRAEVAELKQKLSSIDKGKDEKRQFDQYQAELENLENEKENLLQAIKQVEEKRVQTIASKKKILTKIRSTEDEVKLLEERFKTTHSEIKNINDEYSKRQVTLDALVSSRSVLLREIDTLTAEKRECSENSLDVEKNIRRTQLEITELENKRDKIIAQINSVQEVLASKAFKVQTLKVKHSELSDDISYYDQKMSRLAARSKMLEEDLYKLRDQKKVFDNEISSENSKLDKVKLENASLANQITKMHNQIAKAQEEKKAITSEINKLTQSKNHQQKQLDILNLSRERAMSELRRLEGVKENILDTIELNYEKVDQVKSDLEQQTKEQKRVKSQMFDL